MLNLTELNISGTWVNSPKVFGDLRGTFHEVFQHQKLIETIGFDFSVKQVNQSTSSKGVLRGIHWADLPAGQAKFVSCVSGSLLDFVVDLRTDSPTFGSFDSVLLSASNKKSILISSGIGHAFLSLEDGTIANYLCSEPFNPSGERSMNPLDERIALPLAGQLEAMGLSDVIVSDKDLAAPGLEEYIASGLLPKSPTTLK